MSDSWEPMDGRLLCPWDFPGQEYWSGLLFPSPWNLSNPGIEPTSPILSGGFFTNEPPLVAREGWEVKSGAWD